MTSIYITNMKNQNIFTSARTNTYLHDFYLTCKSIYNRTKLQPSNKLAEHTHNRRVTVMTFGRQISLRTITIVTRHN